MYDEFDLKLLSKNYKWANGFTKVKMNRLQIKLGDGCYYGMMYIFLGYGLPIHVPLGIYLLNIFKNVDYGIAASFFSWFIAGLLIEVYCMVQRDKCKYNEIIDSQRQLNLFRDFGVK